MVAPPMVWSPNRDALRGRVAVVAGATRGAGRGIAAALGEAGATVVCTGRSTRSVSMRSDYQLYRCRRLAPPAFGATSKTRTAASWATSTTIAKGLRGLGAAFYP